ncbi:MAG: alkyl sulfatase dimerization domain-containing protein [Ilumatobacter fluminis]|uniref:alkyl sulfatase dimerization domain-containing protein n=1 Tax=Ilumatobacter fluminis TaxID=467091 RepID=UPI0032EF583D
MADLLALSSRIIDDRVLDEPVNRVTQELSEIGDGMAVVESFSHSAVVRTDAGAIAFDASHRSTGDDVAAAIDDWSDVPVTHLVYTHGHIDHVGGSGAFAERWDDIDVIGHERVSARFERYRATNDWNIDINQRQFGGIRQDQGLLLAESDDEALARWRQFLPATTLWPTTVVGDSHTVQVGDETIELFHDRGETDDHLWAWLPDRKAIMAGDFLIWNFPNAGNPQKVQRYPIEWAAALRRMAALEPELVVPAHGLPIAGAERISTVLNTVADALDAIVDEVVSMMNAGAKLDEIVHTVRVPDDTLALPYLRPLYDEPEFVVRNVWRQFGGWWDGAASRLKPAPDAAVGAVVAELAGGTQALLDRADQALDDGDVRLASHLADFAGWAAPDDPDVHAKRAEIYLRRRKVESSLMSKGIFAAAARESQIVAERDT